MHKPTLAIVVGILLFSIDGQCCCFGQLATAKLKNVPVAYGDIASGNSIVNKGSFTDQSKEYQIEKEDGVFYLLSDGKTKGWVFKSSVESTSPSKGSKQPQQQNQDHQNKVQTAKNVKANPREIVRSLKSNGFRATVDWRKSKIEKGWVAVLNKAVGENEVSIEITGPSRRTISKMTIEAEVYQTTMLRNVTAEASKTLGMLSAPEALKLAMTNATSQSSLTIVDGWTLKVNKHNRGGGFDVQVKRVIDADIKSKSQDANTKSNAETKQTVAKTSATKLVSKFRTKLNANGLNEQIITGLKCKGKEVTITVVDAWSGMDYDGRLQAADSLYKLWAITASPDSPDSARIQIQNSNGKTIGGSRALAGSLIWVD